MSTFVPYLPHPLGVARRVHFIRIYRTNKILLQFDHLSHYLLSSHDLDSSLLATLNPLSSTALTSLSTQTINTYPNYLSPQFHSKTQTHHTPNQNPLSHFLFSFHLLLSNHTFFVSYSLPSSL